MATTITKTIREDASGDYTTAVAWEAGEQTDLVAADQIARGLIQNAWVSAEGEFVIQNWTTDATRYVVLEAEGAARHNGLFTSTAHRFLVNGNPAGFGVVRVQQGHVRLIGLQATLQNVTAGSKGTFVNALTGSDVRCISCIGIVDNQGQITNNYFALIVNGFRCRNCLALNTNGTGFRVRGFVFIDTAPTIQQFLYNCNAIDHRGGLPSPGGANGANGYYMHKATEQVRVINCIAKGNEGEGFFEVFASSFESGSEFNAADDVIPASAKGTGSRENQTFTFVNEAGGDFHLAGSDGAAKGFGTDTTALAVEPFADDIDGDLRQSPFDIGMDQTSPAGEVFVGATVNVIQRSQVQILSSLQPSFNSQSQAAGSIQVVQRAPGQVSAQGSILVKFSGSIEDPILGDNRTTVIEHGGQTEAPILWRD